MGLFKKKKHKLNIVHIIDNCTKCKQKMDRVTQMFDSVRDSLNCDKEHLCPSCIRIKIDEFDSYIYNTEYTEYEQIQKYIWNHGIEDKGLDWYIKARDKLIKKFNKIRDRYIKETDEANKKLIKEIESW